MILHHYADTPITLDRTHVYDHIKARAFKPDGFWLSVPDEYDWPTWCRDEEFCLDSLTYQHNVTLNPAANVLWLETPADIDNFHKKYSSEADPFYKSGSFSPEYAHRQRTIDWTYIATLYDGIIITPYQFSRRLDGPFWYYGWDCASGCIWNLDAIATFSPANTTAGAV